MTISDELTKKLAKQLCDATCGWQLYAHRGADLRCERVAADSIALIASQLDDPAYTHQVKKDRLQLSIKGLLSSTLLDPWREPEADEPTDAAIYELLTTDHAAQSLVSLFTTEMTKVILAEAMTDTWRQQETRRANQLEQDLRAAYAEQDYYKKSTSTLLQRLKELVDPDGEEETAACELADGGRTTDQ